MEIDSFLLHFTIVFELFHVIPYILMTVFTTDTGSIGHRGSIALEIVWFYCILLLITT